MIKIKKKLLINNKILKILNKILKFNQKIKEMKIYKVQVINKKNKNK